MPKNADGPKMTPQIVRVDQLTQRGEASSMTDKWKKNRKSAAKDTQRGIARQRAARLERDKDQ